jgi:hypothetical protein
MHDHVKLPLKLYLPAQSRTFHCQHCASGVISTCCYSANAGFGCGGPVAVSVLRESILVVMGYKGEALRKSDHRGMVIV